MTPGQIETVYEALATRLDRVGEAQHARYLAKLVLLLARDSGDPEGVLQRIEDAAQDLEC